MIQDAAQVDKYQTALLIHKQELLKKLLYSHLTNDELLREVLKVFPPDPLMMELAFRLENEYPNDFAVGLNE